MTRDTERLMFLTAPHLTAPHAFTTRAGGVSAGAYAGLNLDDREDDLALVQVNRERLAVQFGLDATRFARLNQVHGTDVVHVSGPGVWTGDALVTATPEVLLAIGTADCYPVLLHDPQAGVIGAAHAGWKGTLGRIAEKTVQQMVGLGAHPANIQAAVGPGICGEQYEVGAAVAQAFREAGLGQYVLDVAGRVHLDLAGANQAILRAAGVPETQIWVSGRCSTESDFYSYRRDAGKTGRMWAVIKLPAPDIEAISHESSASSASQGPA